MELLRADLSVDCATDRHKKFQIFAGVMVLVYPIGVPLLFLWAMLPYRDELSDVPTRESQFAKGKHLAFFSMDYMPESLEAPQHIPPSPSRIARR